MSNDRTTVSVKRDHIALMNTLFRFDAAAGKYVAQPEVFFNTPNIAVDIGNFIGALNQADSQQYLPSGAPVTPPAAPEVMIGEPGFEYPYFTPERVASTLALFDAAPSEALQWFHISPAEQFALRNRGVTKNHIDTMIGKYNSGGPYPEGWASSPLKPYRGE